VCGKVAGRSGEVRRRDGMSQKIGAKGLRASDLEEEREQNEEMLSYEANLPSHMEHGDSSEVYCL
jgi:hypothetical protein